MTLLGPLPPLFVVVEELRRHPVKLDLYLEEWAFVADEVDKRRREFSAVRRCARRTLTALGRSPAPILPDGRGAPRRPAV